MSACLSRAGLVYEDVEAIKERLGSDFLHTRMVDSGAYCRDVRKYIANGSLKEPPRGSQDREAVFRAKRRRCRRAWRRSGKLFLIAIVAEQVYQEKPELFGGIDDIDAHRARLADSQAKRKELRQVPEFVGS